MQGREHVKLIRLDKRRGLRAGSRRELHTRACVRIYGLDQPRIANGYVDQSTFWIEKGRIRDSGKLQGRNDRDAVRSRSGIQDGPCFEGARIDPSQAGTATVRDQDGASACNDARRFGKAAQRGKVLAGIDVYHLKTVPGRVRDENALGLRFKSPMVK